MDWVSLFLRDYVSHSTVHTHRLCVRGVLVVIVPSTPSSSWSTSSSSWLQIPLDPSYFVHVHEFTKLLSHKQLIHAWFSVTKTKAYAAQGCRVVGAHPSWHRLRGWVHPGQIAIPTDRQSTCTPTVSPANLTCVSLDYEKEPEHPEENHTGKGKHLCTRSLRCLYLSPRLLWISVHLSFWARGLPLRFTSRSDQLPAFISSCLSALSSVMCQYVQVWKILIYYTSALLCFLHISLVVSDR